MKKRLSLFCILLLGANIGFSQVDTTMSVKIGQRCPDLVFKELLKFSRSSARLSDFKGKAVILDFWATWCAPCIKAFPKLEEIQQTMGSELQVLLVTMDNPKEVRRFYEMKKNIGLPTALISSNDSIFKFFPHREIPYYVWLDKEHIVRATTDYSEMKVESVEDLIKGRELSVKLTDGTVKASRPSAMQALSASYERALKNPDTTVILRSSLRRVNTEDPDQYNLKLYVGPVFKNRVLFVRKKNIARLYSIAYGGYNSFGVENFSTSSRVRVESKDSNIIAPPELTHQVSTDSMAAWFRKNAYEYLLVIPPGEQDSTKLFKGMQRDLSAAFGYKCFIAKRTEKCLVLRSTGPNVIRSTRDTALLMVGPYGADIRRMRLDAFLEKAQLYIDGFRYSQYKILPFVNDTGWEGNVDIQFKVSDMGNIKLVNEQLARFNLSIAVEDREIDMLIITDY